MFFRTKKSGPRSYLQVVENHWRDGRPQQTVLATLGRLDELQASGQVDSLLASGARFAQKLLVLSEHQQQRLPVIHTRHWGAPLIFEKLWRETGCQAVIEEQLFARRRDLFTEVEVVFFDTTSLYFEGQGGATLGRYGHSKDHRPDEKQLVVGAVLDGAGRPLCCELWPGNTADVTTLIP